MRVPLPLIREAYAVGANRIQFILHLLRRIVDHDLIDLKVIQRSRYDSWQFLVSVFFSVKNYAILIGLLITLLLIGLLITFLKIGLLIKTCSLRVRCSLFWVVLLYCEVLGLLVIHSNVIRLRY